MLTISKTMFYFLILTIVASTLAYKIVVRAYDDTVTTNVTALNQYH